MWHFLKFLAPKTPQQLHVQRYIKRSFGFKPVQTDLYIQALRHSSAAERSATGLQSSNERLEFLGDAVLDTIVADYLYRQHQDLSEGELTKMKSKVVSRKMLNHIGNELELERELIVKIGNQPIQNTLVGNALEALIGAIYLDQGYKRTTEIVLALLSKYKIDERIHDVTDFKSKLHEWSQKRKKELQFAVLDDIQADANDRYRIAAVIDGKQMGVGYGKSKKSAEQMAARYACERIFGREE